MTTAPLIRRLAEADAAAFRGLRLAGLQESPTGFGSSYAAEKDSTVADFAAIIARNYIAGAFVGEHLAGVAGFYAHSGDKKHRIAVISGASMSIPCIAVRVSRGC
jgi:hypothetical protein